MRYVALLRGINVGGKNMIKMEKLREVLRSLALRMLRPISIAAISLLIRRKPRTIN